MKQKAEHPYSFFYNGSEEREAEGRKKILGLDTVTKSYNVHCPGGVSKSESRILDAVGKSPYPITPREIASLLRMNPNSVRPYLKRLKSANLLVCPLRGHYVSAQDVVTKDRSMPWGAVPRVHCLRLWVPCVSRNDVFDFGVARVVCRGFKDRTEVLVDCVGRHSLDLIGFRVLVGFLRSVLGFVDDSAVSVVSFELNEDFSGVRLDGAKALTLKAFDGSFERLYQKAQGVLRSEVKAVGSRGVEDVYALLKGGVSAYNVFQSNFMLVQKVDKLAEAQKFSNQLVSELVSQNRRLIQALFAREEAPST